MTTFVTANFGGPPRSIGLPLSFFDLRLADDNGDEPAVGAPGEILIRNRQPGLNFLGYFRNEQATREAFRDGWFCTGDLARRDAAGYLYFGGRKKDSVRRRGRRQPSASGPCRTEPRPGSKGPLRLRTAAKRAICDEGS